MISVCIPTYNGEKFISKQIESIIKQLSKDDEIIISDDSSTDNTVEIIKSYNDKRIKLFENNQFHSPIFNLENALKHASGDFIFLSDQDDEWMPNKVTIISKYLDYYPLVIHDAEIIDEYSNIIHESFYKLNHTKKYKLYNIIKNGYIGCCMAFHKTVLDKILPFPKNIPMHDLWIGNVVAFKYGTVCFIQDKLIKYRRHGNNASITSEKSNRNYLIRIKDRLCIINNLFFLK